MSKPISSSDAVHIVWQRITYARTYSGWDGAGEKNNLKKIIN